MLRRRWNVWRNNKRRNNEWRKTAPDDWAGEAAELSEYIKENNPIDVAQAAEYLDDEELWKMCSILSSDDIASVLEQADDELRVRFTYALSDNELLEIFSNMAQDDIADIVGDLTW